MNSFYLNFVLCALLIGCKGVSKDTQIKYLHDQVEEISLLPNIVPIDLLNPTGIVAIDTFLIFVQRHEEKMIKVFYVKMNYNTNELSDTIYINDFEKVEMKDILIYSAYPAIKPDLGKMALFATYMDAITIINLESGRK